MTPGAQQPQREHCEHEFTCIFFRKESRIAWKDGTRCMRNQRGCEICNEDTRTRPHTPAPLCDSDHIPTQNEFVAEFVGNEQRKRDEHDATVARAATLAILTKLERIDKDTTDYAEFEGKVMELIKSLRTAQEQQR